MRAHAAFFATIAAAALLIAGPASAHARLISSNPAANATIAAPKTLSLTFDEKLTPAFSTFELATAGGAKSPVKTSVSKDRKTITGTPGGKLMAGMYKLTWRAATADDGHRMDGVVTFTVK